MSKRILVRYTIVFAAETPAQVESLASALAPLTGVLQSRIEAPLVLATIEAADDSPASDPTLN